MFSQAAQVAWQLFSLRIGTQISGQVMLMLPHERHGLTQRSGLGLFDLLHQQTGRDIHAIEHIAHIMKNAGGDLGHAGAARSFQ